MCATVTEGPEGVLDVFVHVPKTAGSAVNGQLMHVYATRQSPRAWPLVTKLVPRRLLDLSVTGRWLAPILARGEIHIAHKARHADRMRAALARADWVSGHVPRDQFEDHLRAIRRPARFFTLVRDPVAQLASHYQWWIEIHHRGPWQYYRYNRYFRALSAQIRQTDNADPKAVQAVIEEHGELFLNFQSRFVLGATEMEEALSRFTFIGLDRDVGDLVEAMTGCHPPDHRSNVSRSYLDRSVFQDPGLQDFLHDRHGADMKLYARLKSGS